MPSSVISSKCWKPQWAASEGTVAPPWPRSHYPTGLRKAAMVYPIYPREEESMLQNWRKRPRQSEEELDLQLPPNI